MTGSGIELSLNYSQIYGDLLQPAQSKAFAYVLDVALLRLRDNLKLSF
jgi:hypothetical protein